MELYSYTKFIKQINSDINKYKQTHTLADAQVKILLNTLSETVTKQLGVIEYTYAATVDKFVREIALPIKQPFVAVPITLAKRKLDEDTCLHYLNKSSNMYWRSLYVYDCANVNNKSQVQNLQFLYYANHKLVKYNKFAPQYCLITKDGYIYTKDAANNLIPFFINGNKQKWQHSLKYVKHT